MLGAREAGGGADPNDVLAITENKTHDVKAPERKKKIYKSKLQAIETYQAAVGGAQNQFVKLQFGADGDKDKDKKDDGPTNVDI